jgi:hypothetical protein
LLCENQAWEPREKTTHKESQGVAFNEDCGHQNMFPCSYTEPFAVRTSF